MHRYAILAGATVAGGALGALFGPTEAAIVYALVGFFVGETLLSLVRTVTA